MKEDRISSRQFMPVIASGLFSPMMRALPRMGAENAGKAMYLAPLLSVLPVFIYIRLLCWLLEECPPDKGLAEVFISCFGKTLGRALALAFFVWTAFYASYIIRNCAERLISTIYPQSGPWGFAAAVTAVCALAAMGRLQTLARAAGIFFGLIFIMLALVLLSALTMIKAENVLPISCLDIAPLFKGVLLTANVAGTALSALFLRGSVTLNEKRRGKPLLKWLSLLMLLVSFTLFVTIGCYGAKMTAREQQPFFLVSRDVRVLGLFDRIEAAVMTTWVITDFMMVTLLFLVCAEVLRVCFVRKERKWFVPPVAAAALAGSALTAKNAFELWHVTEFIVQKANPAVYYALLPLLLAAVKIKNKKSKKRY